MRLFPPKSFFSSSQEKTIIEAIKAAELATSGEIKVHVEPNAARVDAFERGLQVFEMLAMHQTQQRNAVLFYIATDAHTFSIIADEGINEVVPADFWENIKKQLVQDFAKKQFTEGIVEAILQTGQQLKVHFPRLDNDQNELSDGISRGKA